MMIDDGKGVVIDTESKKLSPKEELRQQLVMSRDTIYALENAYKAARDNRSARQSLKAKLDTAHARHKNLFKKFERLVAASKPPTKEQSQGNPQESK